MRRSIVLSLPVQLVFPGGNTRSQVIESSSLLLVNFKLGQNTLAYYSKGVTTNPLTMEEN